MSGSSREELSDRLREEPSDLWESHAELSFSSLEELPDHEELSESSHEELSIFFTRRARRFLTRRGLGLLSSVYGAPEPSYDGGSI